MNILCLHFQNPLSNNTSPNQLNGTIAKKLDIFSHSSEPSTCEYQLLNMGLLSSLFDKLLCPRCKTANVKLHYSALTYGAKGLHSKLSVQCTQCDITVSSTPTSETTSTTNISSANLSVVACARNCGIGFNQLSSFFLE